MSTQLRNVTERLLLVCVCQGCCDAGVRGGVCSRARFCSDSCKPVCFPLTCAARFVGHVRAWLGGFCRDKSWTVAQT